MPAGALESPWGAVRLGAQWVGSAPISGYSPRGELPRVVRPGEAVELELTLEASPPGGSTPTPGNYVLEVALVQEGVRWFSQTVRIPVAIMP